MTSEPFGALPLWVVLILTIVAVLLCVECGYRLGLRRRKVADAEKEGTVGTMVGASLGLLAFLLAFTFGLAANRFESRRTIVLDESNAIGTTWLRAAMLPEPQRTASRRMLREYVESRLDAIQPEKRSEAIQRSESLQKRLWAEAVSAAEKNQGSIIVGLYIQSLNETIDIHAKRILFGVRNSIPSVIWIVLYLVSLLGMALIGFLEGLSGTRRTYAVIPVVLTFSAVMVLIADLDRPQGGLLRVSQEPMIELRNTMDAAGN